MKKTSLIAVLLILCSTLFAQDKRVYLGNGVYGEHFVRPAELAQEVTGIPDSLGLKKKDVVIVRKTTDACPCTIDQTLINNGDQITRDFALTSTTSPYYTYFTNGNVQILKTGSGDQILMQILPDSVGTPAVTFHDVHSPYGVNLIADYLTTGHTVYLPDGNGKLLIDYGGKNAVNLVFPTVSYTIPISLGFIPSRIQVTLAPGNTIIVPFMVDAITLTDFTLRFDSPQTGISSIFWEAYR